MLIYGTRRPNDMAWFPRSNKIFWRGLGVIGRIESLDYGDGEPDDVTRAEQRQLGLALAAQHGEVDLDAADPARLGERHRLRLEATARRGCRGSAPLPGRRG